jgi:predicted phosphodiesterase
VYGNIDDSKARATFELDLHFMCEQVAVYITHIGGYPGRYNQRIRASIYANPPTLFITGHSHILKVMRCKKTGLLHMNPGAIGKHGFHKVRTMLRFEIDGSNIKNLEVIELKR